MLFLLFFSSITGTFFGVGTGAVVLDGRPRPRFGVSTFTGLAFGELADFGGRPRPFLPVVLFIRSFLYHYTDIGQSHRESLVLFLTAEIRIFTMEHENNTAALNDIAGVLPMDTGITVNGVHDKSENKSSSNNTTGKKGRGRPPKSASSPKASTVKVETPKRGRGRPSKTTAPVPTPKKVPVIEEKKEEKASTNGSASEKKRGRPAKSSTPTQQINGINKPQVQSTPVLNDQKQESADEPEKKKRGRPSNAAPKKAAVPALTKQRGRPPASAGGNKSAPTPTPSATSSGSAKKRGRPKKAAASPSAATSVKETTTASP